MAEGCSRHSAATRKSSLTPTSLAASALSIFNIAGDEISSVKVKGLRTSRLLELHQALVFKFSEAGPGPSDGNLQTGAASVQAAPVQAAPVQAAPHETGALPLPQSPCSLPAVSLPPPTPSRLLAILLLRYVHLLSLMCAGVKTLMENQVNVRVMPVCDGLLRISWEAPSKVDGEAVIRTELQKQAGAGWEQVTASDGTESMAHDVKVDQGDKIVPFRVLALTQQTDVSGSLEFGVLRSGPECTTLQASDSFHPARPRLQKYRRPDLA